MKRLPRWIALAAQLLSEGRTHHDVASDVGVATRTLERWIGANETLRRAALAGKELRRANRPQTPHGTTTRYGYGCRCAECREAHTVKHRELTAAAHRRPTPDHVHGSTTGYAYWGCRCAECREANTAHSRARRAQVSA